MSSNYISIKLLEDWAQLGNYFHGDLLAFSLNIGSNDVPINQTLTVILDNGDKILLDSPLSVGSLDDPVLSRLEGVYEIPQGSFTSLSITGLEETSLTLIDGSEVSIDFQSVGHTFNIVSSSEMVIERTEVTTDIGSTISSGVPDPLTGARVIVSFPELEIDDINRIVYRTRVVGPDGIPLSTFGGSYASTNVYSWNTPPFIQVNDTTYYDPPAPIGSTLQVEFAIRKETDGGARRVAGSLSMPVLGEDAFPRFVAVEEDHYDHSIEYPFNYSPAAGSGQEITTNLNVNLQLELKREFWEEYAKTVLGVSEDSTIYITYSNYFGELRSYITLSDDFTFEGLDELPQDVSHGVSDVYYEYHQDGNPEIQISILSPTGPGTDDQIDAFIPIENIPFKGKKYRTIKEFYADFLNAGLGEMFWFGEIVYSYTEDGTIMSQLDYSVDRPDPIIHVNFVSVSEGIENPQAITLPTVEPGEPSTVTIEYHNTAEQPPTSIVSTTAPVDPDKGDLWFNPETMELKVFVTEENV